MIVSFFSMVPTVSQIVAAVVRYSHTGAGLLNRYDIRRTEVEPFCDPQALHRAKKSH